MPASRTHTPTPSSASPRPKQGAHPAPAQLAYFVIFNPTLAAKKRREPEPSERSGNEGKGGQVKEAVEDKDGNAGRRGDSGDAGDVGDSRKGGAERREVTEEGTAAETETRANAGTESSGIDTVKGHGQAGDSAFETTMSGAADTTTTAARTGSSGVQPTGDAAGVGEPETKETRDQDAPRPCAPPSPTRPEAEAATEAETTPKVQLAEIGAAGRAPGTSAEAAPEPAPNVALEVPADAAEAPDAFEAALSLQTPMPATVDLTSPVDTVPPTVASASGTTPASALEQPPGASPSSAPSSAPASDPAPSTPRAPAPAPAPQRDPGERDRDLEDDLREAQQIVFYTSRDAMGVSRDTMLRQVGLAKGLMGFSNMIERSSDPFWAVHSQNTRLIIYTPEPDWYIHICVTLALVQSDPKKDDVVPAQGISDRMLVDGLQRGYDDYVLLHGTFDANLSSRSLSQLEKYWTRFAFSFESGLITPQEPGLMTWLGGWAPSPAPPLDTAPLEAFAAAHLAPGSDIGMLAKDRILARTGSLPTRQDAALTRFLLTTLNARLPNPLHDPPPVLKATSDRQTLGFGFGRRRKGDTVMEAPPAKDKAKVTKSVSAGASTLAAVSAAVASGAGAVGLKTDDEKDKEKEKANDKSSDKDKDKDECKSSWGPLAWVGLGSTPASRSATPTPMEKKPSAAASATGATPSSAGPVAVGDKRRAVSHSHAHNPSSSSVSSLRRWNFGDVMGNMGAALGLGPAPSPRMPEFTKGGSKSEDEGEGDGKGEDECTADGKRERERTVADVKAGQIAPGEAPCVRSDAKNDDPSAASAAAHLESLGHSPKPSVSAAEVGSFGTAAMLGTSVQSRYPPSESGTGTDADDSDVPQVLHVPDVPEVPEGSETQAADAEAEAKPAPEVKSEFAAQTPVSATARDVPRTPTLGPDAVLDPEIERTPTPAPAREEAQTQSQSAHETTAGTVEARHRAEEPTGPHSEPADAPMPSKHSEPAESAEPSKSSNEQLASAATVDDAHAASTSDTTQVQAPCDKTPTPAPTPPLPTLTPETARGVLPALQAASDDRVDVTWSSKCVFVGDPEVEARRLSWVIRDSALLYTLAPDDSPRDPPSGRATVDVFDAFKPAAVARTDGASSVGTSIMTADKDKDKDKDSKDKRPASQPPEDTTIHHCANVTDRSGRLHGTDGVLASLRDVLVSPSAPDQVYAQMPAGRFVVGKRAAATGESEARGELYVVTARKEASLNDAERAVRSYAFVRPEFS